MLLKSILFVIYLSIADSGSPEECSAPMNLSDCGLRPTIVYTSFSPMAMCHPAIWRGCPTKNKFVSEYQCLEFCLNSNEVLTNKCDVPLNTSRCSKQAKKVYTFSVDKNACVKALWYGCPSENIFTNMTSCMNVCPTHMEWVDKLARMDISELRDTSKVLNELINKLGEPKNRRVTYGKRTTEDDSAKAYFIRKLQKVNKELDKREQGYTDLMLLDGMSN